MTDLLPQWETQDKLGSTFQLRGAVSNVWTNIPSVAGNQISELVVDCDPSNPSTRRLEVSLDGGTNYHSLRPGDSFYFEPRGLLQIQIRSNSASLCVFAVTLNLDDTP